MKSIEVYVNIVTVLLEVTTNRPGTRDPFTVGQSIRSAVILAG